MNPPSDERPTPPAVSQKDWSASTADSLLLGRSWNYGSPDYGYSRGPSQRAAPVRSPLSPVSQQLNNSHISTGSGGFYGLYGSPTLDGISPSFPQVGFWRPLASCSRYKICVGADTPRVAAAR